MATNDVEETEQIIPNEEVEKVNEPVSYLFIVLFYFLGATCFIPNNFYVTANEYWMFKFRDPHIPFNNSDTQKTTLQKKFTAYTNMVGSIGMILFLFITFAISKKVSLQKRIVGGMFLLLVLFCITLLFVFVNTDSWQIGFFVIAVGISGLFSASTAVLLISLFQLSARFPPRCMAAQLAGQSVCGILSASIQVLTLLAAPTVKGTAGLYYAIATGVITATTIAYLTVSKKSEYLQNKLENDPEEEEEEEGEETSSKKFDIVKIKRVLRKLALILVSLTLCGVITQLLHPGLTALIESSGKGTNVWSDSYFLPVCVFLLFNTMEFIGRELSNHIQLLKNKYLILGTSVTRVILFPLILLCNIQPRNHLPVVFHDDVYFIIFMILLAFSNGYVQNMVIIVLPNYCSREDKKISMLAVMLIMVVFMTSASILSGVLVSLI
ncbi:equilibrative nucleoside transporter 3 isoform X1 [Anoplophora glabripennis]|uniref:Equilibrative nucleoside transporter 3 n=1 Tax=Anoplophora glabripennis TaxID=217634 RepID=V5G3F5_ANOGL|nr:equilibrative nucleoside transporter 3 isoform X1 [Anoplophora glabripennis]